MGDGLSAGWLRVSLEFKITFWSDGLGKEIVYHETGLQNTRMP